MTQLRKYLVVTATMLVCVALLLAAYGGWLRPSSFGPIPALAVISYPFWVMLAAIMGIVLFVARQYRNGTSLLVALIITWPTLTANYPLFKSHISKKETALSGQTTFTLMTWNVAGWDEDGKVVRNRENDNMRFILNSQCDIVVLQEASNHGWAYDNFPSTQMMTPEIKAKYPYRSQKGKIILLSKFPFESHTILPPELNFQYLGFIIKSYSEMVFDVHITAQQSLRIVACHLNSFKLHDDLVQGLDYNGKLLDKMGESFSKREAHAALLREKIDTMPSPLILCGDFNDVPQSCAYRILKSNDMTDARIACGRWREPTFRGHQLNFEIDHILYRGAGLRAMDYRVDKVGISDHYPIITKFTVVAGDEQIGSWGAR